MASYFVFHTNRPKSEESLFPLEGKGYSLKVAKDYARIHSAHGFPSEVYRGRPTLARGGRKVRSGKLIRRYEAGDRVFPLTPEDLEYPVELTQAEVPSEMKQRGRRSMAANPVVIGTPQPTKTLRVRVYKSGPDWVGELASYHKNALYREMLFQAGKDDAFDHVALITFPRKPRLTDSQNRTLSSRGEVAVRMPTRRVEKLIDSTWR